ncbi:MAG: hypothetical protein MZU97_26595 [Bacillus subtilis]|nr:hypothetical protein [Bacillus subtilis]
MKPMKSPVTIAIADRGEGRELFPVVDIDDHLPVNGVGAWERTTRPFDRASSNVGDHPDQPNHKRIDMRYAIGLKGAF